MAPFAPGSIAVLLAPHDLAPEQIVEELLADAHAAEASGFDGVLVSEHHAGLAGYVPNPLQVTGWALGETRRLWGAPCPLLLPLRATGIVAEEAAWLSARFPGRVGLGVGAGAAPADFEVAAQPIAERTARYKAALPELDALLSGGAAPPLALDPAVARCAVEPIPVVSAAATVFGVRLAARAGAGIMLDGLSPLPWSSQLSEEYRQAGGRGRIVLSRRVWLGEPPLSQASDDVERYRSFTPAERHDRITADDSMIVGDTAEQAALLLDAARRSTLADCLSLRVNLPGLTPAAVREQIGRLGTEVLPLLR